MHPPVQCASGRRKLFVLISVMALTRVSAPGFAQTGCAPAPASRLDSTLVRPGETVSARVFLTQAPVAEITGYQTRLSLPADVSLVAGQARLLPAPEGMFPADRASFVLNPVDDQTLFVAVTSSVAGMAGRPILELPFRVSADAAPGPRAFTFSQTEVMGTGPVCEETAPPSVSFLTVTGAFDGLGDVNGDGAVTVTNALRGLKIVVGGVKTSPGVRRSANVRGRDGAGGPLQGDPNSPPGDGVVTVDDVVGILQAAVGLNR